MSQEEIGAFVKYAQAFELGFATNDWSVVDALVSDDIVWTLAGAPAPLAGTFAGRLAVMHAIKKSVDGFDRRFDRREPLPTALPVAIPGGIHLTWTVTYTRKGLPPFVLRGEEWDLFRDGKLDFHRELIHNGKEALAFLTRHDAQLLPV